MFPIICLSDQLETINKYILHKQLKRDEILQWLAMYGALIMPDEENSLRHTTPLNGLTVAATKRVNAYIFRSNHRFLDVTKFVEPKFQIMIACSMSDFWGEKGL